MGEIREVGETEGKRKRTGDGHAKTKEGKNERNRPPPPPLTVYEPSPQYLVSRKLHQEALAFQIVKNSKSKSCGVNDKTSTVLQGSPMARDYIYSGASREGNGSSHPSHRA